MFDMENDLTNSTISVTVSKVIEKAILPVASSCGEVLSSVIDGTFGWIGYLGEKSRIVQQVNLEKFKQETLAKVHKIPNSDLLEPKLHVIGNTLEASKYSIEESTCRAMFSELIASSLNSQLTNRVHPSFPEIIKQLSPLDARFISLFKRGDTFPIVELTTNNIDGSITPYVHLLFDLRDAATKFTIDEQLCLTKSVDSLIRFGILFKNNAIIQRKYDYEQFKSHWHYKNILQIKEKGSELIMKKYRLELTLLGRDFVETCVPEDSN